MFLKIQNQLSKLKISLCEDSFIGSINRAQRFIENWDDEFTNLCRGKNGYIDRSANIHNTAVIGDEIYIGPNVLIGPYCFVRSKTILFPGVKLGYGVELDRIILFENVKIAHIANLGRAFIGRNCNFGYNNVFATKNLKGKIKAFYGIDKYFLSEARHHGGVMGDNVVTGVNVSFMPGSLIFPKSIIMPCSIIKGVYR